MFNIIIRRAVVVTAGAGIALTLMAAPASAAPKADGGRQGAATETQTEEKTSAATITVTVSCDNVVTVTSDKDISHVEWELADGTVEKQEGLRGYTWTRTFDQDVVWAKAKSGETIVFGYPENCDEPESTPEAPASDDDVKNGDDVKNQDDDVKGDNKAPANNGGDSEDDGDEVDDETLVNEPTTPAGTEEPSIAPEAFKCGEVMATDVNGDGRINSEDCTVVLGEVFERAPAAAPAAIPAIAAEAVAATPAGAQVLGVQFDRAAPAALARTGATFAPLLLGAIVLIASGLLMVHGRRRDTNA